MGKFPKKLKPEDIETEPGAEERFERTVRRMLNTPPNPRQKKEKTVSKPSKNDDQV